ncbi:MAG TPA: nucleotidyltransferase domain-containing protein [Phycisphaerales bacterium]|nr:nucleotidyltransferase domain-containing protein [Phycisphaerales bacterium]
MIDRKKSLVDIDEAVRRIVEQFHPAKIILFGSHAQGSAGRDSDVDLLVVMNVEGSKRRQAVEIDLALSDRSFPLDLIVVTPEEFEKYRDVAGHILYPVVREGKVLYGAA